MMTDKKLTFVEDGDGGALLYYGNELAYADFYNGWNMARKAMRSAGIEVIAPAENEPGSALARHIMDVLWTDKDAPRHTSLKELKSALALTPTVRRRREIAEQIAELQKALNELPKDEL